MKRLKLTDLDPSVVQHECRKALKNGDVIVCPTDTVYGLLADATSMSAIDKLITLKARPPGKPISIFVGTMDRLREVVNINEATAARVKQILPGPFTIVLPSKQVVDPRLESEVGALGVRIPKYDFVNQLVEGFGKPVSATSANLSGMSPHYTVDGYLKTLPTWKKELIGLVLDVGPLPRNKPSTVVDMTSDDMRILREGDQSLQMHSKYTSNSAQETTQLAHRLIKRYEESTSSRPLVILLEAEVGAGKTVFVKGVASHYEIDNVISPTFVVYYDYPFGNGRVFVHADLYNVHEPQEFEHLGLGDYLHVGTVMCVEWSDRSGPIYQHICDNARVVQIRIEHVNEHTRTLFVDESKM